MTSTLLIIGFAILMLPSLVFIPLSLPGVSYLFIVSLVYAFIDGFIHITSWQILILAGIAIISILIDQFSGLIAAHYGGAKGWSFLYGILGLIVGNILFPVIGGFVGLFLGLFLGEIYRRKKRGSVESNGAIKAATLGVIGSATGMVLNIILAIVFMVLFLVFVL